MKIISSLSFIILLSFSLFAQKSEQIKSDDRYIWGESTAESLEKADIFAMKDLVSQISAKVESSFSTTMIESGENLEEYTRSAINTYSNIYLNDAKRIVTQKHKKVSVLRYMDKKAVSNIFKNRKSKILDYTSLAVRAEKNYRIADALRYYYWALALLNSHPEKNSIKYSLEDNSQISLITFVNNEIDQILQNLDFIIKDTISTNKTKSFVLEINYKNFAVSNLDYVFWTGNSYSNLYSAKDGRAIVEFFNNQADDFNVLRINIEYQYLSRTKIDSEVESVMAMASLPRLKNAEITIPLNKIEQSSTKIIEQPKLNSIGIMSPKLKNELPKEEQMVLGYKKSITEINQLILSKNLNNVEHLFTDKGLNCYNKIIKYGNATLLPNSDSLQFISIDQITMMRSVPMLFSFPNNNQKFIEDIVYVFDSTGKVDNINFALSNIAINNILSKSQRFGTEEEKFFLINFLENYKTAYSLENLDYIESIFAEDALIIVGTVLIQAEPIDGMYKQLDNQNIKYTRYSKSEYINHLEKAFNSKEYLNIEFEETDIKKIGGDQEIYGIQLAQNYYSSNYSDKGYLFLMIDLNDIKTPRIYVRTWQPEKNADGSVIGLENFTIK
jgi:hypothetical protein